MVSVIPHIDWVACACSLVGAYLCAKKIGWCWLVWGLSNLLWALYAIPNHLWSLITLQVVFFTMNVYGAREWIRTAGRSGSGRTKHEDGRKIKHTDSVVVMRSRPWNDDDQYYD